MILYLVFILFISTLNLNKLNALSCIDENGSDTDWSFVYKLPYVFDPSDKRDTEYSYLYRTNSHYASNTWRISNRNINSPGSIPFDTLQPIYNDYEKYSFISYNDKPPSNRFSALNEKETSKYYGNSKGVLAFDYESRKAIWILTSAPYFPKMFSTFMNGFPYSRSKNSDDAKAHTFLCIQLNFDNLIDVLKHLIITKVKVYDQNLKGPSKQLLEDAKKSLYTKKVGVIRRKSKKKVQNSLKSYLTTAGGNRLVIISKHRKVPHNEFWKNLSIEMGLNIESSDNGLTVKSSNSMGILDKLQSYINCRNGVHDVLKLKLKLPSKAFPKHWGLDLDESQWVICGKDMDCVCAVPLDHKPNPKENESGTAVCIFDKVLHDSLKNMIEHSTCH